MLMRALFFCKKVVRKFLKDRYFVIFVDPENPDLNKVRKRSPAVNHYKTRATAKPGRTTIINRALNTIS